MPARLDLPLHLPDDADPVALAHALSGHEGVLAVVVDPPADGEPARARISYDDDVLDPDALRSLLGAAGVEVRTNGDTPPAPHGHTHAQPHAHTRACCDPQREAHDGIFGERTELGFAILAGVFLVAGFALGFAPAVPQAVALACFVAAYGFGGFFATREAWASLRRGQFDIDFLMLAAAAGAAVLGEWLEGALLLFLFSLGHALEHHALGRARRAIEALGELTPDVATVLRGDGTEEEVPIERLRVGDRVRVRTHERLPADGFVAAGTSDVDQSPVTGESIPVDKRPVPDVERALEALERLQPAHRVFAGTINGAGALEVVVTRLASESALARVVQMVSEAQANRSPTQRFAERFERIFVPAVLALVVLLLLAPLVVDEPFSASFYRALAVLVAASPCALAISTPAAVLSGVARAGRGGVLVKGGGPLEALGEVRAIAFDKTGTLTQGTPRVTDVVPAGGVDAETLLAATAGVERLSDHPLAAAVERLERDGRTTMIVRRGDRFLGVVGLMDTPRESAPATIDRLRALGIEHMVMISGDNVRVARAVADAVGLDEARGDLMPDDKVETIREMAARGNVAMVGDGVNDAPAMAHASVGIAMGAAGSDVALETADVALMADDLSRLPFAVGLSRFTRRIIVQNLWISLGMIAFLVPAAIFGLGIGPAVALHEGSTLVVVFNALRLLGYRGEG